MKEVDTLIPVIDVENDFCAIREFLRDFGLDLSSLWKIEEIQNNNKIETKIGCSRCRWKPNAKERELLNQSKIRCCPCCWFEPGI